MLACVLTGITLIKRKANGKWYIWPNIFLRGKIFLERPHVLWGGNFPHLQILYFSGKTILQSNCPCPNPSPSERKKNVMLIFIYQSIWLCEQILPSISVQQDSCKVQHSSKTWVLIAMGLYLFCPSTVKDLMKHAVHMMMKVKITQSQEWDCYAGEEKNLFKTLKITLIS